MVDGKRPRVTVDDEDWKAHVEGRITGLETSVEGLKHQVAGVSSKIEAATTAIFGRIENLSASISESRAINWPLVVSMIVGSVAVLGAGAALYKTYVDMTVLPIANEIASIKQKFKDDREGWIELRQEQFLRRDQAIDLHSRRLDLLENWAQEYRDRNESSNARQWEQLNSLNREVFDGFNRLRARKPKTPAIGSGTSPPSE